MCKRATLFGGLYLCILAEDQSIRLNNIFEGK